MVYSISRLNTFNTCEYGFYLTYGLKEESEDNIYSFAGSKIHDIMDRIYNEKKHYDIDRIEEEFEDFMMECSIIGLRFPSDKIEKNWLADMTHFVSNYTKLDSETLHSEERVLTKINGVWLQGYIDYQELNEDGTINIIDWKTSSKFTGKRLKEAGRQLLVYKLAKESEGLKVDRVGWFMTKYLNISYYQKNGKKKTSMYPRSKWVYKLSKTLEKMLNDYTYEVTSQTIVINNLEEILEFSDVKINNRINKNDYIGVVETLIERYPQGRRWRKLLEEYGHDEFYNSILVEESIVNNNLDNLPENFQKLFTIEDCLLWYEYTEEDVEEVKEFVKETVKNINNKDLENDMDWNPDGIMTEHFYCENLCGQRSNCFYSVNEEKKKEAALPF